MSSPSERSPSYAALANLSSEDALKILHHFGHRVDRPKSPPPAPVPLPRPRVHLPLLPPPKELPPPTEENRELLRTLYPDHGERRLPESRSECVGGPRPCPLVSCRYHLYLHVTPAGTLQLNFPGKEVEELKETCALDVADRGGTLSFDEVGELIGLSKQRIQQIDAVLLRKLKVVLQRRGIYAESDLAPEHNEPFPHVEGWLLLPRRECDRQRRERGDDGREAAGDQDLDVGRHERCEEDDVQDESEERTVSRRAEHERATLAHRRDASRLRRSTSCLSRSDSPSQSASSSFRALRSFFSSSTRFSCAIRKATTRSILGRIRVQG